METAKKQFRNQFKYGPISFKDCPEPMFSQEIHGYKIYRALQLLLLKDENGDFFAARLT